MTEWITVREAARRFGDSPQHIYNLALYSVLTCRAVEPQVPNDYDGVLVDAAEVGAHIEQMHAIYAARLLKDEL
jgi:hypothetical protein